MSKGGCAVDPILSIALVTVLSLVTPLCVAYGVYHADLWRWFWEWRLTRGTELAQAEWERERRIIEILEEVFADELPGEGTVWIEYEGTKLITDDPEGFGIGWLISGYDAHEPESADGTAVARRQRELYERRKVARWDDPILDLGERIFRIRERLRGFEPKDQIDALVVRGRAWVVVDDACGYPDSYVLRAGDLPSNGRLSSDLSERSWVLVEAWDAS
jgi:hypothetical protein